MTAGDDRRAIAFAGARRIAEGGLTDVARAVHAAVAADPGAPILVFDARTSAPIDLDLRGSADDAVAHLASPASDPAAPEPETRRGPGRPKLGVVAREVTLLPRHWEWLARQPGGASVALRRLVDEARRTPDPRDRQRVAREAAYRFMSALAGDAPGFEEATRALFADDRARFDDHVAQWPADVRAHARTLATAAFDAAPTP